MSYGPTFLISSALSQAPANTVNEWTHGLTVQCLLPSFNQYPLCLLMQGRPGWVDQSGWLCVKIVSLPANGQHRATTLIKPLLFFLLFHVAINTGTNEAVRLCFKIFHAKDQQSTMHEVITHTGKWQHFQCTSVGRQRHSDSHSRHTAISTKTRKPS